MIDILRICVLQICSTTSSCEEICDWLCKFNSETRKADGKEYTPCSLYLLLAALQRYVRKMNPHDEQSQEINFLRDPVFRPLKNVCDAAFKGCIVKG